MSVLTPEDLASTSLFVDLADEQRMLLLDRHRESSPDPHAPVRLLQAGVVQGRG